MSSEKDIKEFKDSYTELVKEFQETNENQQSVYEVYYSFKLNPSIRKVFPLKKKLVNY
jgi:hypothetical protein